MSLCYGHRGHRELGSVVRSKLLVLENVHVLTFGTCLQVMYQSRMNVADQLIWGQQDQHGLWGA